MAALTNDRRRAPTWYGERSSRSVGATIAGDTLPPLLFEVIVEVAATLALAAISRRRRQAIVFGGSGVRTGPAPGRARGRRSRRPKRALGTPQSSG
jgi:hypothetical protein